MTSPARKTPLNINPLRNFIRKSFNQSGQASAGKPCLILDNIVLRLSRATSAQPGSGVNRRAVPPQLDIKHGLRRWATGVIALHLANRLAAGNALPGGDVQMPHAGEDGIVIIAAIQDDEQAVVLEGIGK
jgi:hypothetical protein